jgi:3-isopropylmalate/(R)-2-methylmalate dehydratase small subunit
MTPVKTIEGKAYPFGLKNVDTDIIIPAHWLKTISRTGLGKGAFEALRKDPDNLFDSADYAGSPILIAGDNFGCGSSREHAAWALADMRIQCVIAPSFSDIFSGNAFKNGILTVVLPQEAIDRLMAVAQDQTVPDPIHVDLENQVVTTKFQDRFAFEIDSFRKHCLTKGLDEIGLTMAMDTKIATYEHKARTERPWLFKEQ